MTKSDGPTNEEVAEARRFLEVLHGDHLRTAYISGQDEMESHIGQAEGISQALNIVEQLESGDWDADDAATALDTIGDDNHDVDVEAEDLRDLSQHVRNRRGLAPEHRVIKRVQTQSPRGYWALLKDILGVSNRV